MLLIRNTSIKRVAALIGALNLFHPRITKVTDRGVPNNLPFSLSTTQHRMFSIRFSAIDGLRSYSMITALHTPEP
jgi:hypothetical protein